MSKRAKIHLIDVSEPLLAFHDLQMRCGAILHTAVAKFMEAEDLPNVMKLSTAPMKIMGICTKCMGMPPQGADKRQYVYGMCEAETTLHEEATDN